MNLFIDGKYDVFPGLAAPAAGTPGPRHRPFPRKQRNRPPLVQIFCCMVTGRTELYRNYPVATKRILRAVVKGADLCATNRTSGAIVGLLRRHATSRLRIPSTERITLRVLVGSLIRKTRWAPDAADE